jgi:hypothetical protein
MDAAGTELSISRTATQTNEEDIRLLMRANRTATTAGPCEDILAAGATFIAPVDKPMEELQMAWSLRTFGEERISFSQDHFQKPRQMAQFRAGHT